MRSWVAAAGLLGGLVVSAPAPAQSAPLDFWNIIAVSDRIVVARIEHIEYANAPTIDPLEVVGDEEIGAITLDQADFEDELQLEVVESWKGDGPDRFPIRLYRHLTDELELRADSLVVAFLRSGESIIQEMTELEMELAARQAEDVCLLIDGERIVLEEPWHEDDETWRQRLIEGSVGRWFPVDFHFGLGRTRPADAGVFGNFVREALALQAEASVGMAVRRDWTVRAACRRATRRYGLQGLAGIALEEEMRRIAEGFVREPSGGEALLETLEVVSWLESPEFDVAVISVVETALQKDPPPDWVLEAAQEVIRRFGGTEAAERFEMAGGTPCNPAPPGALLEAWTEELARIGAPMALPLPISLDDR